MTIFRISPGSWKLANVVGIPISALAGDNVVSASDRMPWYEGPTLLRAS